MPLYLLHRISENNGSDIPLSDSDIEKLKVLHSVGFVIAEFKDSPTCSGSIVYKVTEFGKLALSLKFNDTD